MSIGSEKIVMTDTFSKLAVYKELFLAISSMLFDNSVEHVGGNQIFRFAILHLKQWALLRPLQVRIAF